MAKFKDYTFGRCIDNPQLGWKLLLQGWVFNGICTCGSSIAYNDDHKIETKKIQGPYQWSNEWIAKTIKDLNCSCGIN